MLSCLLATKNYGYVDSITLFLKKDKIRDFKLNQLKLQVHDTYEKDEKIRTNFEPVNDEDVVTKAYLDEKSLKKDGNI